MPMKTYSRGSLTDRFWSQVTITPGCWLWTGAKTKFGYGRISLNCKGMRVHRLSYEIHIGIIPENMAVLHKCDVPNCVNPDHLFLGDNAINQKDRKEKGRSAAGESNGRSVLTKIQVERVINMKGIIPQRQLAKMLGVSKSTIGEIHRGKSWRSIK